MMSEVRITMRGVAEAAGVSAMTVSRVLRNDPRTSPAVRAKVLSAVRKMGYRLDPRLAHAMRVLKAPGGATVAVIREYFPQDGLLGPSYQYVGLQDIRTQAASHGFSVEEFWLGREGLTPRKLVRILKARGIEGLIVSPMSKRLACAEIDFTSFSAVTFGYAMTTPALHMAGGNVMGGMLLAFERLRELGYRRIGVALTRWIVGRSQSAFTGGLFSLHQDIKEKDRVPFLELPHELEQGQEVFCSWVRRHSPDVVISMDTHAPRWIKGMGLRMPEDIAFVSYDWVPSMSGYAGIDQRRPHVAAAAVDLLAVQMSRFERGVPAVPRQVLIPSAWVDGDSVPERRG
jgi:LacI family transcriptional regulator